MVPEIVKSVIRQYCMEHTDTSEEFDTCYDRAIERYEEDEERMFRYLANSETHAKRGETDES